MTPYEISIMLHIYTRAGAFSDSGIDIYAPIFDGTISAMRANNLIVASDTTEHGFMAASRGAAYVEFLMQMPLPEQKWVLPEINSDESAALTGAREMSDWQPIETAPRDGKPVLLWRNEHWVAARITGEHGPGWCTPDGYQIFHPTHWMPLPEPPND